MSFIQIVFYPVFGLPLALYAGAIVFILLITTAVIGKRVLHGKMKIRTHQIVAGVVITLAFLHAAAMWLVYVMK